MQTDVRGLDPAEAARRLRADGPNAVPPPPEPSVWGRIGRQLVDPLILLLVAALVVTLAIGDIPDALVIGLVVVVNTAIGVTQEVRAGRAVAALNRLAAPVATVVRGGADIQISTPDVVRGDLVRLAAGDIVPADLELLDAQRLQVDESAITGESVPVWPNPPDHLQAGTVIVAGRGLAVATRTGPDSGLGRIAALVHASGPGRTPLQRRLAGLGRVLGATAVVASAVVFGLGILSGQPVLDMAIAAVSLVVAAVPESLPAVVTLALALAARRMAAQRAIPRQLPAVETLGSVTVVASDKTGTITEGRMSVQTVVDAAGREYRATGVGYDPVGQITGLTEAPPPELLALARAGLLCNDASLTPPDPDGNTTAWTAIGDPLEAALLAFAARCGLDIAAERAEWPRIAEEPFDQQTRRMTTTHARFDGARLTVCKGAPESVLHAPILASPPPAAVEAAHRLATAGLRVVVVAGARAPAGTEDRPLEYLGVIGIGDPVRATARGVADEFDRAGIRLLLITGDHPGTASAVGAHLGIWREGDEVHHGDSGPPDAARAAKVRVFARTQPEQKLDIIAGLQSRGHVVAMTGDGVNDAPALRRADIGVAMGGGTEVARQAADVVLVDDNLATLSGAVREGRRIYDNIRRFLLYGLAGGTAEILVMLCGPLVGLPLPLLPAQILWINLLTHGVPGVAMGAEPAEADVMSRPPRPPGESVLGDGLLRGILLAGSVLAATTLAAGGAGYLLGRPWQSMIFVTLGLAQLAVALAVRVRVTDGPRSRALLVAVAVSVVLQLAGVWFPPLQALLGTEPLTLSDLAICLPLAIIPAVVVRLRRAGRRTDTIRP